MAQSIVIVGPQGCGKTINAPQLIKAYGMKQWVDADECESFPQHDHLILAHETPRSTKGLKVIPFSEAIKKVRKPHPSTPATKA